MLKDKVVQSENGRQYYVLEEINYDNKKYALALECDIDNDLINKDDYIVMEVTMNGDDLFLKNINDDDLAKKVISLLFNKIKN